MRKYILHTLIIFLPFIIITTLTNAQEVNLTGTWEGTCYNKTLGQQAKLTVKLEQNGENIKGYMKAGYPLLCRGPLKAWLDERERLNAKIRCIIHLGHAIHLVEGIIDIKNDSSSNQTIGEISGSYRLRMLLSKYEGEFTITKSMQITGSREGYTATSFYPVFVNADSNIYHKADCPKLGNNIIEFDSPEQARNAGGVPCENCNP